MAKKDFDFQKEWSKTKKQLVKFSQEAAVLAKQGEKELVKFSKRSKLHLDSSALSLKKEHLYHLIGKEYVRTKGSSRQTVKMKKLLTDLSKVDGDLEKIQRRLKHRTKKP